MRSRIEVENLKRHYENGCEGVSPEVADVVAKILAWVLDGNGQEREEAVAQMTRATDEFHAALQRFKQLTGDLEMSTENAARLAAEMERRPKQ